MSTFYKVLVWITSVASLLCLSLVIWAVLFLGWHSLEDKSWRETMDRELAEQRQSQPDSQKANDQKPGDHPSGTQTGANAAPPPPLTAEQKAELQQSVAGARTLLLAEIHAADADERAILDRLITLVGVFSAILALCAFATVRLAREDAQAQQNRIKNDLDEFKGGAEKDLDNFRKQIWSELPQMRNLKDSLRDLMLDLERTIPYEADWNDAVSYDRLDTTKRENILIAEGTVNALKIFVSRDSPAIVATQARLYSSLARFYFGRFRAEKGEADGERAHIYTRKAGEMEPNNSAADRLRGAIFLAQYRILKDKVAKAVEARKAANPGVGSQETAQEQESLGALLDSAEDFLKIAIGKDKSDAGAALNLALAARYRGDFDRAIKVSRDAIANRGKMNSQQVQKYLPSLYLNLACYLARKADTASTTEAPKGRTEAVNMLTEGMKFLQKQKNAEGIKALREMILREKGRQDAFKNLSAENLAALDALVAA